ncbi:MAG: DUF3179 domain-containing protein [Bacteroidota bacterium]
MKYSTLTIILLFLLGFIACEPENVVRQGRNNKDIEPDTAWLINRGRVLDGGPGKDGIPSIENPEFVPISEVGNYILEEDLIVGVNINGEIHAYPHPILNWHEIVNDSFGGELVTLNYCPLTGSAFCWDRSLKFMPTTFGVSGLLYNNNLIMYDRDTDSYWSQLYYKGVYGDYRGEKAELIPLIETSWANWKAMYPNAKILSTNTGFDRKYEEYPYNDYRTQENFFIFSFIPVDDRINLKERVHAVLIDEEAKAYRFESFVNRRVIQDEFKGRKHVIYGDPDRNLLFSWQRELADGTLLEFEALEGQLPALMKDQEGNHWDGFGYALSGPRTGERLVPTESVTAYWFSIGSFYPKAEIYDF